MARHAVHAAHHGISFSLREKLAAGTDERAAAITHVRGQLLSGARGEIARGLKTIGFARGNALILKRSGPSLLLARTRRETGVPDGVFNVLQGDRQAGDDLLAHPDVDGMSFAGSTPIAKGVHQKARAGRTRAQAPGGAENHVVVMPGADMDLAGRAPGHSSLWLRGRARHGDFRRHRGRQRGRRRRRQAARGPGAWWWLTARIPLRTRGRWSRKPRGSASPMAMDPRDPAAKRLFLWARR